MYTPPRLTRFGEYCARQTRRFGAAFTCAGLPPSIVPYFNSGERVRVEFAHGETLTGTVSVTTGWAPQFLLMRTSRSIGSTHLISDRDRIVAVKRGRRYVAVAPKEA